MFEGLLSEYSQYQLDEGYDADNESQNETEEKLSQIESPNDKDNDNDNDVDKDTKYAEKGKKLHHIFKKEQF